VVNLEVWCGGMSQKTVSTNESFCFHSRTMHLDIIKVFYLPTDAQENCFKRNIKIYIKPYPANVENMVRS
jgi:hypothetical protein